MKRRTVLIAPASIGASAASLYGVPGSASAAVAQQRLALSRLTLSLARMGTPLEAMAPALRLTEAAKDVLLNHEAAQGFMAAPEQFFRDRGIAVQGVGATVFRSPDGALFRALLSPAAQDALRAGELDRFLLALEQAGAVAPEAQLSDVAQQIARAMETELAMMQPVVSELLQKLDAVRIEDMHGQSLQAVLQLLREFEVSPSCTAAAVCWIAVAVYTYGIAVSMLSLAIGLWVRLAVWVDAIPQVPRSTGAVGLRLLPSVAPEQARRYDLAARVAMIRGRRDIARQLLLKAHGAEIRVLLDAMEHTGRFDLSGERRGKLETALLGLALEAGSTR